MPTAIHAPSTSEVRAETRPNLHLHPRSAQAIGRAQFHADAARRLIASAREHRLAGRADWARNAMRQARLARAHAIYEFGAARREG